MSSKPANQAYNEQELLQRIAEGDAGAFTQLVNDRSLILYNFIFKISRQQEVAEEIVQDIFTQLWLTRENLTAINNMNAYLFTIAKNHTFHLLKKMEKERTARSEWGRNQEISVVEDSKDKDRTLQWVLEAVEQLSPQQKKVWQLSRREGKKYKEIAGLLGISTETVKSYLKIANAAIIASIKKRGSQLMQLLF